MNASLRDVQSVAIKMIIDYAIALANADIIETNAGLAYEYVVLDNNMGGYKSTVNLLFNVGC